MIAATPQILSMHADSTRLRYGQNNSDDAIPYLITTPLHCFGYSSRRLIARSDIASCDFSDPIVPAYAFFATKFSSCMTRTR